MTMQAFQQAMCDLVASPDLCLMLVQSPEQVLGRYDLSDRDRRRLIAIVQQRGMLVNCSLYRANRLSPIYSTKRPNSGKASRKHDSNFTRK